MTPQRAGSPNTRNFFGASHSLPSIDIILDPSVIPSLPPLGGHFGHADLMGRQRIIAPSSLPDPRPLPLKESLQPRPVLLTRSSSFEERARNNAGVGAGSSPERYGPRSDSLSPPRPAVLRRTSSFEDRLPKPSHSTSLPLPGIAQARRNGRAGHARTASDSTTTTERGPRGQTKHNMSNSSIPSFIEMFEGCIRLGSASDSSISKLLVGLQSLVPPSRAPATTAPPASSCLLHPPTLLTPLAIVLEALVTERTILRGETCPPRLPPLADGNELQINGGQGELDWRMMRAYMFAVGSVLSALTPLLQDHPDRKETESLTKGLRVYVGKQKKVFSEIATMYVDGYSFVKGWWNEGGMKASASEVGRWGDLYDA